MEKNNLRYDSPDESKSEGTERANGQGVQVGAINLSQDGARYGTIQSAFEVPEEFDEEQRPNNTNLKRSKKMGSDLRTSVK